MNTIETNSNSTATKQRQPENIEQKFRLANFHFKFATIITANAVHNETKSFVGDGDRLICFVLFIVYVSKFSVFFNS